MENLPRPFSRKYFTAYGGGGGKSMYDDVFGGAPKSGLNSLAPRLQDYTEIFGGFHSSRSSSIPVLDLPSVNVNEHAVDVRSSRFDYSEVFSRPNGVDFVVSFEDLVCEANGGYDSSDEAWSPTHSGSLSGETEPSACSEKSQSFPNADINHYNVSYNKTHQRSQENISNDLHAIPVYTCVVDETTVSEKVHEEERFYQIHNDLKHSPDFEDRVVKEKRYSKTNKSGHITSVPHLGVSEISLRTKPSQLPPPSRPAPVLAVKKGESGKLRASKSYAFERGLVGDNFSPFFDVELDGYSSSATIKDDAETRSSIRSTEKVIELQVEDDMKVMKRNRTQSFDKCNDKELNLNLLEKSVERKHRRSYTSSEGYFKREENVAWREEAGFYEVETDIIHQVKSKNIGKRVELKESNNKTKSAKEFLGPEDNFNQPKVSKQEMEAKTEKKVIKDVDSRKGNEIEFEGVHCEKGEEVTVEEIKAEEAHDKEEIKKQEMEGKKKIQEESLERKESTNEKELNGIRDGENDEHIELKSSLVNEDYKEILQKSCEHEEIQKDFEASLKEDTCKIEKDHTEIIQNEAVEQAIAFKDTKSDEQSKGEKFMAFGNYEPNLQFKPGFVPRNNNQNVLQHEEHTKKPNEVGSVSEKPSNSQVKVVSSTENMPIISPEVVVPVDKGNTREKLTSHEVVKEWVDNAKNINDSLQSVLEDIGVISDSDQSTTTQESPDKAKIGKTFKNKEIIIEKEMERQREKEKDMMAETRRIKERELEKERIRKIEEEREREREREKDRMDMDSALRERSYLDAREKSERATYEVRQRVMAEARERLEKASAEAREARMRAERSAVERATMEARQRAFAKSMAEPRDRLQNTDIRFQRTGSSSVFRYTPSSSSSVGDGESPQRCKARLERYQRTAERAAKALAEKNTRDLAAQREQEERSRLAEILDVEVRRWSSGKEGNLRALLSTLQYILGADGNWQPIPLTEVITSAAVKRAYRKATLYVHPDKLQQRGASIQQKYICEKVFDLLKDAWSKFNSEER